MNRRMLVVTLLFTSVWCGTAIAVPIADSTTEFSDVQGQDGWFYGFFNQGATPSTTYTSAAFEVFDSYNTANMRWEASDALVGGQNNVFLSLSAEGGHPTGIGPSGQDRIIWAVRRYTSQVAGLIDISYDLRKENFMNPEGGGITGRIFVDGVELFTQLIGNLDSIGVQGVLTRSVSVGSVIDFAIDPKGTPPLAGVDGIYSARADGTHFSATIQMSVPEPATFALMGLGLAGIGYRRRQLQKA